MMKKAFILILLLCSGVTLYGAPQTAPQIYIAPEDGAYGIPMDSPVFWKLAEEGPGLAPPFRQGAQPLNAWNDLLPYLQHTSQTAPGYVGKWNRLFMAGVNDINVDPNKPATLKITITSPAGLNFISLSNPNIVRPYSMTVFGKSDYTKKGGKAIYHPMKEITENGMSYSFTIGKNGSDPKPTKGVCDAWFTVVLNLPGSMPPENIKAPAVPSLADEQNTIDINGYKYRLVDAKDYSSVIFITIEYDDGSADAPYKESMSLPLSGFYDSAVRNSAIEANKELFGMHVMPTAYCANLDLKNQQGKVVKIASLNLISSDLKQDKKTVDPMLEPPITWPKSNLTGNPVMKEAPVESDYGGKKDIYKKDNNAWKKFEKKPEYKAWLNWKTIAESDAGDRLYLFLSSSPDPFVSGERFMLVHDQAPANERNNPRMSLAYNLLVRDIDHPERRYVTYDGTKSVQNNYDLVTDPDLLVSIPRDSGANHGNHHSFYHNLNAEIFIFMQNKQGIGMMKGRYEDTIYIHVIGPDGANGGG